MSGTDDSLSHVFEIMELIEDRYGVEMGPLSGFACLIGIASLSHVGETLDDWHQRTWIGKAGSLAFLPFALVTSVVGAISLLLGLGVYLLKVIPCLLYRSYQSRAFKEEQDVQ